MYLLELVRKTTARQEQKSLVPNICTYSSTIPTSPMHGHEKPTKNCLTIIIAVRSIVHLPSPRTQTERTEPIIKMYDSSSKLLMVLLPSHTAIKRGRKAFRLILSHNRKKKNTETSCVTLNQNPGLNQGGKKRAVCCLLSCLDTRSWNSGFFRRGTDSIKAIHGLKRKMDKM